MSQARCAAASTAVLLLELLRLVLSIALERPEGSGRWLLRDKASTDGRRCEGGTGGGTGGPETEL